MTDIDTQDPDAILAQLRRQAETDKLRITLHGHQEMVEEDISLEEILEVLLDATFVENYAEHRRGPCCLVWFASKRHMEDTYMSCVQQRLNMR